MVFFKSSSAILSPFSNGVDAFFSLYLKEKSLNSRKKSAFLDFICVQWSLSSSKLIAHLATDSLKIHFLQFFGGNASEGVDFLAPVNLIICLIIHSPTIWFFLFRIRCPKFGVNIRSSIQKLTVCPQILNKRGCSNGLFHKLKWIYSVITESHS